MTHEPRPAATVMLVRDSAQGELELFMQLRPESMAFPGAYAFPGGSVDARDRSDDLASCSLGFDDVAASSIMGLDNDGLAYWHAAIRECFEEVGVLFVSEPVDQSAQPTVEAWRSAIDRGDASMPDLCRELDAQLDTALLRYVGHFITPEGAPKRFDARFFLAEVPAGQQPDPGGHVEIEACEWVTPAAMIERWQAGEAVLIGPTARCVDFLARYPNTAALVAAVDEHRDHPIIPKTELWPDSPGALDPAMEGSS